jgi:hypothetical protein
MQFKVYLEPSVDINSIFVFLHRVYVDIVTSAFHVHTASIFKVLNEQRITVKT